MCDECYLCLVHKYNIVYKARGVIVMFFTFRTKNEGGEYQVDV